MEILCLDMEGVLTPEIWEAVAEHTQIPELLKTTRDIPVYDDLMRLRLKVIAEHDLSMSLIEEVVAGMDPLPGAVDFLSWARPRFQIAIISDTYYQFAMPLVEKLGGPLLLCHNLEVENDRIVGYRIRQPDPKRRSVQSFKSLNYRVFAVGDSYNDVSMLEEADAGFFYRAPGHVRDEFLQFEAAEDYPALQDLLEAAARQHRA